eukprot:12527395-Alexandrium_andersonii.AAC.1
MADAPAMLQKLPGLANCQDARDLGSARDRDQLLRKPVRERRRQLRRCVESRCARRRWLRVSVA